MFDFYIGSMIMYTKKNSTGTIHVSKNVIGSIVADIADKSSNKVILCNSKGKTGFNENKSMSFLEVNVDGEDIYIKIYILVKFGTSISRLAGYIIEQVREMLKTTVGIEPKQVSLCIKGVMSRNVSKRDIEVTG